MLVVLVVTASLGRLALPPVSGPVSDVAGVQVALVTTAVGVASAVRRAVGEEVFFRGLIAGLLFLRWGFGVGSLVQVLVLLLPHTLLLTVDLALWPLLPVQLLAGWLLGWLRYRSGASVHLR